MTAVLAVAVVGLLGALAALGAHGRRAAPRRPPPPAPSSTHRVLFPFVATALSRRALDAALRLARAEDATLMPVSLACVPLALPLDAPLPRQSQGAIGLQEAIEHRAAAFGVPVDARIERGRSPRHGLRQAIAHEHYEQIVVAAAARGGAVGFGADDVAWLLDHAPGEIVVLRPASEDCPLAADIASDGGDAGAPATRTQITRGA